MAQGAPGPLLSRRLVSFVANRLISRVTGVRLRDYGCSLKVFQAEVVKSLRLYGQMHRFIPAIASEQGVRIAELVVNHRPADTDGPSTACGGRRMSFWTSSP